MIHPPKFQLLASLNARWIAVCLLGLMVGVSMPAAAAEYASPISLIPDTAAGAVRVPNMPEFCGAWKTTTLHKFVNDPSMQEFVEAQRSKAEQQLLAADLKVGIKPRDLLEIASGEVVVAWLPFTDPRRPFSVSVIADVRGFKDKAVAAIEQVDKDLKAGGAVRKDVTYGADTIRVYALKQKPGQLKIEQVAICLNDDRLIASDRDSVVTAALDSVAGKSKVPRLIDSEDRTRVLSQVKEQVAADKPAAEGVVGLEWFARPISMGRILKEAIGIDRGRQVDVLSLLERQGFDAVRAAGGQLTIGSADFDLVHHGFVLAPPTTTELSKYKLAAKMLQFPNSKKASIPTWVSDKIASLSRMNWEMDEAFWASETLINDAFGDEIFRDIFDGIRDDEDGPKIDMQKKVVPNLGKHIYMLTDNNLPASETSERLLVAIEVIDTVAIRDAVKRAMEVEPDAALVEGVPGVDIYRVLRTDEPSDFDSELFEDIGLGDGPDPNAPPPLLNQWAIAVVDSGDKGAGYLVFSSHPELLVETVKQMKAPQGPSFAAASDVQKVVEHLNEISGEEIAMSRIVRTNLSLRVKYMLLREAKLRESDSLLASLARRMFDDIKDEQDELLQTKKLPPFESVEKYFRPGGSCVKTVKDGWIISGFLLK